MTLWLFYIVAIFAVFVITYLIYRYALARNMMDYPTERSSHTVATPRGGGMSIVIVFLCALPMLNMWVEIPGNSVWALMGAGGAVALVGFVDDHVNVSLAWRLATHFCGAIWVLVWLGGLPPLAIFGYTLDLSWLGHCLCVIYLVWMINIFNFMDGIDGIASIEVITACFSGVLLYILAPVAKGEWAVLLLMLSAALGFVLWNFPKAHIFLGDVGSGFLGVVLGAFSVRAAWLAPELFWGWIIILGSFIVDATLTLVRRIMLGEKYYDAHRSHAYQYAARKFDSHPVVTFAVALINLLWLLPLALLVTLGVLDGAVGVLVAYIPLVWVALYFKAGSKELQGA